MDYHAACCRDQGPTTPHMASSGLPYIFPFTAAAQVHPSSMFDSLEKSTAARILPLSRGFHLNKAMGDT